MRGFGGALPGFVFCFCSHGFGRYWGVLGCFGGWGAVWGVLGGSGQLEVSGRFGVLWGAGGLAELGGGGLGGGSWQHLSGLSSWFRV